MFELLIASFKGIMEQTCPVGWRCRKTEAERLGIFDQHDAIAAAIVEQDPKAASRAMAAHFDSSTKALIVAGFH